MRLRGEGACALSMAVALRAGSLAWFLPLVLALVLVANPVSALEKPSGGIILTVDGKITITNGPDGQAVFDRAMIEAMDVGEIITETPWTDGAVRFEGVRVRDLLAAVGAEGSTVHAIAINDYAVEIPIADFNDYDVILAYRANGKTMRIRDKGPLWVIYPWNEKPELRDEVHHTRSIWQLKRMTVK